LHVAFVSKSVLRSHWDLEYRARRDSSNEKALDDRLAILTERTHLKETSTESAFIDVLSARHCYANWPLGTPKSLDNKER
jgi:hypothetical protein